MPEVHPINSYIETASGKRFHFDKPEFDIYDMATHLSRLCRYTGAVKFYSVAEHCVMVSWLAKDPLEGLLHDGPEAYMNDISSPLKRLLPDYRAIEARLYPEMARHFGVPEKCSADTHRADVEAFFIESAVLRRSGGRDAPNYAEFEYCIGKHPVNCWTPNQAYSAFKNRFDFLIGQRAA